MIDDLQDVKEDSKNNFRTLYSNIADKYPLDELINKTHHFGEKVLSIRDQLLFENKSAAFEIMKKSNILMLIGAVVITSDFYSPSYIQRIESHSVFHFSFWKDKHVSLQNSDLLSLNFSKFLN